jgi:hypothetical protein
VLTAREALLTTPSVAFANEEILDLLPTEWVKKGRIVAISCRFQRVSR